MVTGTKNVVFIGCREELQTASLVSLYKDISSLYPVVLNCTFPYATLNDNGTITETVSDNRGNMRVGMFSIFDNPGGIDVAIMAGRNIGTKQRRIGVMNDALNAWSSYIDIDGCFKNPSVATAGTLPAANETNRGKMILLLSNGTDPDQFLVCMRYANGTYSWRPVTVAW
jgi:hypothetical protein